MMYQTHTKEALDILHEMIGGWYVLLAFFFATGCLNFMFVWVKGIRYLDEEFSPEKNYDDTWTFSAGWRFFTYCGDFLRGKIKATSAGMRVWMCFNSAFYVLISGLLLYSVLFDCYIWISAR